MSRIEFIQELMKEYEQDGIKLWNRFTVGVKDKMLIGCKELNITIVVNLEYKGHCWNNYVLRKFSKFNVALMKENK